MKKKVLVLYLLIISLLFLTEEAFCAKKVREIDKIHREIQQLTAKIKRNNREPLLYYNRGCLYMKKGLWVKAEKDFSMAVKLYDEFEDALYNRALARWHLKKVDKALEDLNRVIYLNPKAVDALCNRANILYEMGRYDEALADIKRALKIDPNDKDLLSNMAAVYKALGEDRKAKQILSEVSSTKKREAIISKEEMESLSLSLKECEVENFIPYAEPSLRPYLKRYMDIKGELDRSYEELYRYVKANFGRKISRKGNTLIFYIKGEDPRWVNVFGPMWKKLIRARPNEPRYFTLGITWRFDTECEVLRRCAECLKDQSRCEETHVSDSSIQLKKIDGKWRLVNSKPKKEWEMFLSVGKGFCELLRWSKEFLKTHSKKMEYEELMIRFATRYVQKMGDIIAAGLKKTIS